MSAAETTLSLSWSTSRGADTYGWNICRLSDESTGKRFRTTGGGYDMVGTVLADWFVDAYADRIMAAVNSGELIPYTTVTDGPDPDGPLTRTYGDDAARTGRGGSAAAYGLTVLAYGEHAANPRPSVDGACGESSVRAIMRAIGLDVRGIVTRGHTTGYTVTDTRAHDAALDTLADAILATDADGPDMVDTVTALRELLDPTTFTGLCARVDVCPVHLTDTDTCADDGAACAAGGGR